MRLSVVFAVVALLAATLSGPARAGSYNDWEHWLSSGNALLPPPGDTNPFRSVIALGGAIAPEYLGSDEEEFKLLPLLETTYRGRFFISTQQGVGYNIWNKRTYRAGPRVTFDLGRDSADSPVLAGLPNVDPGAEVGFFVDAHVSSWRYRFDIRQEVAGGHGGFLVNGDVAYGGRFSQSAALIIGVGATYMGDKYAESYFGVPTKNAVAGRPAYNASGGIRDVSAYAQLIFDITDSFFISGEARAMKLIEPTDSPIVKNDTALIGSIMAGVRF